MQPLAAAAAHSAYMLCFVLLACKDAEVLNTEDVACIVSRCSPQVSLLLLHSSAYNPMISISSIMGASSTMSAGCMMSSEAAGTADCVCNSLEQITRMSVLSVYVCKAWQRQQ